MQEQKIISGCKARRSDAQKAFVDMYSRHMYAICVRYTGDKTFAKDCLQEALIQVLNNIDKYTEIGKFKAWVSTVTVKKCLDIMRKEKRRRMGNIDDSYDLGQNENVHSKMEQDEVLAFVKTLPPQYRIAINMFLIEGYSHKEIAKELSITEGSSRSLVSRGRQMIMKAFKEEHMQVVYKQSHRETNRKSYLI